MEIGSLGDFLETVVISSSNVSVLVSVSVLAQVTWTSMLSSSFSIVSEKKYWFDYGVKISGNGIAT